jgi:MFS family permease
VRLNSNVLILALCQALMMTANSLLIASSALVGLRLAANDSLATLPLALQLLSTMVASIPASLLMGRVGRRAGFMLGSVVGVAGAALGAAAIMQHRFWWFCAAAALLGLFNGFGIYYRFAAADAVPAAQRTRAISYVLAGGVLAAFLGPNLANWTRDAFDGAPFAGSLLALVLVYLASLLLQAGLRIPVPPRPSLDAVPARPLAVIARQPVFLVALLCATLGYALMSFIMTATPLAMHRQLHDFSDTAFVIQWHVFAMFAPSFITARLIERVGVLSIMLTGAACIATCIAVNLLGATVWHYWTALCLLGVGWNFLFVGGTTLLTGSYREAEKARAQALNDFVVFTAVAAASWSAGLLHHELGWRWLNLGALPAVLAVFGALLWLRGRGPLKLYAARGLDA